MKLAEANVVFLTTDLTGGGAENHFCRLAPHLLKGAHHRIIVTLKYPDGLAPIDDLPIHCLGWNNRLSYPQAILRLGKLLHQKDSHLLYSFSRCANFVAYYAIRLFKRKVVWISGVTTQPKHAFDLQPTFMGRFWLSWERQTYPKADLILCNSVTAKEELTSYFGCLPERVALVKNPVPLADMVKKSNAYEIPEEFRRTPYILTYGRFDIGKGFEDLIKSYAKIVDQIDHHLLILGDGPLRSALESLVKKHRLENRIHFVGWLDNPMPYLRSASLFVNPSYLEGLPNVVLEAMALGIPVVSTLCTSWVYEYADAKACLAVPVGDIQTLTQAVLAVIESSELKNELIRSAKRIIQSYDTESVVKEYDDPMITALDRL